MMANWSVNADTQHQEAASRQLLRAGHLRREGSLERPTGREMPGDIHGHSGQLSGGRSTAWESHHSSEGGAGD